MWILLTRGGHDLSLLSSQSADEHRRHLPWLSSVSCASLLVGSSVSLAVLSVLCVSLGGKICFLARLPAQW